MCRKFLSLLAFFALSSECLSNSEVEPNDTVEQADWAEERFLPGASQTPNIGVIDDPGEDTDYWVFYHAGGSEDVIFYLQLNQTEPPNSREFFMSAKVCQRDGPICYAEAYFEYPSEAGGFERDLPEGYYTIQVQSFGNFGPVNYSFTIDFNEGPFTLISEQPTIQVTETTLRATYEVDEGAPALAQQKSQKVGACFTFVNGQADLTSFVDANIENFGDGRTVTVEAVGLRSATQYVCSVIFRNIYGLNTDNPDTVATTLGESGANKSSEATFNALLEAVSKVRRGESIDK